MVQGLGHIRTKSQFWRRISEDGQTWRGETSQISMTPGLQRFLKVIILCLGNPEIGLDFTGQRLPWKISLLQ